MKLSGNLRVRKRLRPERPQPQNKVRSLTIVSRPCSRNSKVNSATFYTRPCQTTKPLGIKVFSRDGGIYEIYTKHIQYIQNDCLKKAKLSKIQFGGRFAAPKGCIGSFWLLLGRKSIQNVWKGGFCAGWILLLHAKVESTLPRIHPFLPPDLCRHQLKRGLLL